MDKKNNRVLGILIRSERISKGYSLRELGQMTNISHTLISNIEKGKMIPNNETLRDLFRELDLVFYDDLDLHNYFVERQAVAMSLIFTHDYSEAFEIISELKPNDKKLMYSIDGVDYVILKGLYYTYVNEKIKEVKDTLKQYRVLIDFFTEEQKQLVYFIEGMLSLHDQKYLMATEQFQLALSLGTQDLDLFIKEYLMKALVKQYKFIDTYRLGTEIIKQFEERTIYIRAMKTKLTMVNIFYHIAKNEEVYELTSNVLRFAEKYNIPQLIEECILYHVKIDIRNKEYTKAEMQLTKMPNQNGVSTLMHRFKIAYIQDREEGIRKYYKLLMSNDEFLKNEKEYIYLQVQAMSKLSDMYDREKYLEMIQWLIDFSTKNNDQQMITLSYNHLLKFYYQDRSYKKAIDIANKLLHFKKIRIDNQI